MNLVLGGQSRFGKELQKHWDATYLSRSELDLTLYDQKVLEGQEFENIVILTKSKSRSLIDIMKYIDGMFNLLKVVKFKKAWMFTSGMGTYHLSKNSDLLNYSVEKNLQNFISYKLNFKEKKIILIQPGHMTTEDDYQERVKTFMNLLDSPPEKNLIYDLVKKSYIPY